jgi:hypothetical protein
MALTLVNKVMGGTFKQQQPPLSAHGGSRKRAESGSFSGGENPFPPTRRHNSMDNQPGFSRGGYCGGARGGKTSFNDTRGGCSGSSGHSGDKRYYKSGDRSSGGKSGGRSGNGAGGYKSRY